MSMDVKEAEMMRKKLVQIRPTLATSVQSKSITNAMAAQRGTRAAESRAKPQFSKKTIEIDTSTLAKSRSKSKAETRRIPMNRVYMNSKIDSVLKDKIDPQHLESLVSKHQLHQIFSQKQILPAKSLDSSPEPFIPFFANRHQVKTKD